MSLSEQDIKILQDIAILEGKCMESVRCKICPFRAMCLPEFLNLIPPTAQQREKMAVSVLTHHALIDGDISIEEIKEDYKWDKR
jgi:hypothetical protein